MRQLAITIITLFLLNSVSLIPVYSALNGRLEYQIPIDYSQLSENELNLKAEKFFYNALKTNDTKVNGASEILRDDIRQEIADKIGDFFVLPSSIHETLIIPKSAGMDRKELEQMVQEVNQTQVLPEERLSDHVYEYDVKEHELFRSDRAGEREKQKEKVRENKQERPSLKSRLAEKQNTVAKMDEGRKQHSSEKKIEAAI